MRVRSAAPGVMPGTDLSRSAGLQAAELSPAHLPGLPELPARGLHSRLLGRSIAQLPELSAELTSYGWRLTQRPGADQHRTAGWLRSDVDTLADVRGHRRETDLDPVDEDGLAPPMVIELLGPVSLLAQLALPSGEKALTDHGARADLAQALAAGAAEHIAHVRRACAPSSLTVVIAEPDYRRVRQGRVPTVSGYRTIRALPRDEARTHLGTMLESLQQSGVTETLLDLGGHVEAEHLEDFRASRGPRADGFAVDATAQDPAEWERTAELVESGATILASVLTGAETARDRFSAPGPHGGLPQVSALMRRIRAPWDRIGMPLNSLENFMLVGSAERHLGEPDRSRTASLTETQMMQVITRVRDTAEGLQEQIRDA